VFLSVHSFKEVPFREHGTPNHLCVMMNGGERMTECPRQQAVRLTTYSFEKPYRPIGLNPCIAQAISRRIGEVYIEPGN